LRNALLIVAGLVLPALGVGLGVWQSGRKSSVKFNSVYQAVLLDNGQVYYGEVQGLGTAFPVLRDVYYVEHEVNPQTKEVKNILVRRGSEWHAPDRMVIKARHIVMVEPVSPGSKVAQLIADLKTQNH
jgi:hypothetical protein